MPCSTTNIDDDDEAYLATPDVEHSCNHLPSHVREASSRRSPVELLFKMPTCREVWPLRSWADRIISALRTTILAASGRQLAMSCMSRRHVQYWPRRRCLRRCQRFHFILDGSAGRPFTHRRDGCDVSATLHLHGPWRRSCSTVVSCDVAMPSLYTQTQVAASMVAIVVITISGSYLSRTICMSLVDLPVNDHIASESPACFEELYQHCVGLGMQRMMIS